MSQKFGVKEVVDLTLYDLATNKPVLHLDTLKMSTIENTASSSSARGGKGNPKLLTWDFDRESTMQCQDALMSTKSIALLTGNDVVTGAKNIHKREEKVAVSGTAGESKVTLDNTIVGGDVYAYVDGEEVAIKSKTGTDVTFDEIDVPIGETVEVYYQFESSTDTETMTITSDSFPKYYKAVGDTVVRNAKTGEDEPFQVILHKVKIQPGFTLTFQADGDPTVFDMNMEVFRRDEDTSMIEMIKY